MPALWLLVAGDAGDQPALLASCRWAWRAHTSFLGFPHGGLTLCYALAGAGVRISLLLHQHGAFSSMSLTASMSLSFSKYTIGVTHTHIRTADKHWDSFTFLKQNSITQTHLCCFSKARSSCAEFQFLLSLVRLSQPSELGCLWTQITSGIWTF